VRRIGALLGIAVVATMVAACTAPGVGGGTYSRDQARREQTVRMGHVESVREVNLEGTRTGLGAGTGAVAGGVAGSTIGHGTGSALAAIACAVVGGVAGGIAGYMLFTDRGRGLRRRIEPALEDFAPEVLQLRGTVNRAMNVASQGWNVLNDALGERSGSTPFAAHHQSDPF